MDKLNKPRKKADRTSQVSTVWSISSRHRSVFAKISLFSLIFATILMLNLATALAQVQNHPLSQVFPIDKNLDMGIYQVNASSVNATIVVGNNSGTGPVPPSGPGVYGTGSTVGVYGHVNVTGVTPSYGVYGNAETSAGVNYGVYGRGAQYGVYGTGGSFGVRGTYKSAPNRYGVLGTSSYGVYGQYDNIAPYGYIGSASYGVYGRYDNNNQGYIGANGVGVYGKGSTWAGRFEGNVTATGNLSVSDSFYVAGGRAQVMGINMPLSVGDGSQSAGGWFNASQYGLMVLVDNASVIAANSGVGVFSVNTLTETEGQVMGHLAFWDDGGSDGWAAVRGKYTKGAGGSGNSIQGFLANGTIAVYGDQGDGDFAGYFIGNVSSDTDFCIEGGNCLSSVSGGGIDGSGSANNITKWVDSNTVTTSVVYETGGKVGIGTTNPLSNLSVGGDGDSNYAIYGHGSYGVFGNGTTYGVYGWYDSNNYGRLGSNNFGVYGRGSNYGVFGSSNLYGVYGYGSYGVYGYGANSGGYFYDTGGTSSAYLAYGQYGIYSNVGNLNYLQGSLGINDSNPDATLDVLNTGTGASFRVDDSSDGDTTPFIIDADGNVGIGKTNAHEKLSVLGNFSVYDGPNSPIIQTHNSQIYMGDIAWDAFGTKFTIDPEADAEFLFENGNVGIGNTNPQAKLEVSSVIKSTPTDSPGTCNTNLEGGMYYDASMNEPCFCDGSNWQQFDGGGVCT